MIAFLDGNISASNMKQYIKEFTTRMLKDDLKIKRCEFASHL